MFTVPGPPTRVKFALVGLIVDVHVGGAPSWVTVNVRPATVSVPVRGDVNGVDHADVGDRPDFRPCVASKFFLNERQLRRHQLVYLLMCQSIRLREPLILQPFTRQRDV